MKHPETATQHELSAERKLGGRAEALTLRGGGAASFSLVACRAMGNVKASYRCGHEQNEGQAFGNTATTF